MKIKKYFSQDFQNQIWRLLISDKDKLIIETRNPNTKEAFFDCFDIYNKKFLFSDFQLDEKYYIGIETIYKEIIYFHKFPKPDLPNHKEIIAFDINTQKILWTNNELSFLFAYDDKIFAYKQGFEDRYFFALNYLEGIIVNDFGTDYVKINSLRRESENLKDYSHFIFPQVYLSENQNISKIINDYFSRIKLIGDIEYGIYNNLLLLSYHSQNQLGNLKNNFAAIDMLNNSTKISVVLNENIKSFMTDSFFMYKNFLILLKEKNGLIIYKME